MANTAQPRDGEPVKIKDRQVKFSYWPMYKSSRRYGLQSHIFATNPWAIILASLKSKCPAISKAEAIACLTQAEQFFKAASEAQLWASKPLLIYYCIMNLAKAYALLKGQRDTFDQAQHGLAEKLRSGGKELVGAYLEAFRTPNSNGKFNNFDEFLIAIYGSGLPSPKKEFDIINLLPQVVAGHRLWCEASGKRERFIAIEDVKIINNEKDQQLWLQMHIFADDLTRLGITHKRFLQESRLNRWREVMASTDGLSGRKLLRFEQEDITSYTDRPSDRIPDLIDNFRHNLWATVTNVPPYRKYYLYLAPQFEQSQVLPQLLSIYAIFYYLGSITRYRPQQFDAILNSRFGEQIQEILTSQPSQFIYLFASEFAQREVTLAALV
jgi:hypothetical protein